MLMRGRLIENIKTKQRLTDNTIFVKNKLIASNAGFSPLFERGQDRLATSNSNLFPLLRKGQGRFLFLLFLFSTGFANAQWQSELLKQHTDGSLSYIADADGFRLPDFSHAGYMGGGVDLPNVEVVKTISPISGDNTSHIQAAIDEVGKRTKDTNGFRGALLLTAGEYQIKGTLQVKYDGVVIRGVGQDEDKENNTIIYALKNESSNPQRDVVLLGNTSQIWGRTQISGTKTDITDDIVPVGAYSFRVANAGLYKVGDKIVIYHPCTQAWIDAVDRGGVPYPDPSAPANSDERWREGQLPIIYNRYIRAIDGNTISIDAPVFYTLKKSLAQSYIYKGNFEGTVYQIGIENLRIEIENDGDEDEAHAWQAIRFKSVENAWARNCTMKGFGQSGIITEACTRSTFEACSAIDPVAKVTGERMYNFNTYHYSQLNLFKDCYARNGRHHYVSNGTSTTSGNVFLRCVSDAVNSVNEGHRQWTQGMLYDNYREINLKRDFVLGLYNRVAMGTGHGWSAVHSVLWNCDVGTERGRIGLQKPPTSQNYAIGCTAKNIVGNPVNASNFTLGYVEGHNRKGLQPESLYEAQLAARKNMAAGSESVKQREIGVYYDKSAHRVKIDTPENMDMYFGSLFDLTWKIIAKQEIRNNSLSLSSSLLAGIYIFQLSHENLQINQKILVR